MGVVGVLAIAACYAVGPVDAPKAYVASNEPAQVWVVAGDSVLLIERPQILGDTLVGFVSGGYRELALTGVSEVRARRFDVGRTAGAVAALVFAVGFVGVLLRSRRRRPAEPGTGSS